ncbi:hypothetical protein Kpol_322p4 [Vanderwaltozyma polyspora DSM 70294]|uniref:DNA primase n=1 Tax=Vanderwaltozyma polyspora (strain ATCC 22028 / DSM 70294 / BCRC 21397 / CBS 2163 / NBRC 10782 / NRRL Y-8283 / UCD 57-17) TaxID=436907 RepID=A7TSX8_VANPO|nr:uncharacterized protein Kpol_322p4 [Vanderwaltozyma polyspora DSM 70294]EDO14627.1 hypothetical protein Kpol_322p4 [Vanderwaltozyma polyspora DSM 70294]
MTNSTTNNGVAGGGISSEDMRYYYQFLFPFKPIFNWLNHSPKPSIDIINREFAMAFRSGAYKRYNSFSNVQEFKAQIERANPDRFEIGAIYNKPPKDRDSILKTEMKPLEKELVFDIDMDDYDTYRTCCSGAQVCNKCWKFITLAMKVMEVTLKEDFGFNDFIWVFSGRRGAHCWISDKRARIMNDLQRKNVLDYVNVVRDRNADKRLSLKRPYHPHLSRSLDILKPYFVSIIIEEQNPWENDKHAFDTLLTALHDKQLIDALKKYWTDNPNRSSRQKWSDIDEIASTLKISRKQEFVNRLKECKEDLVLATLYPKLDVEVTKQTIHLLKSPFCIHPSTGNVCVPIVDGFTPDAAPKLIKLQSEMESNNNDVEQTSLQPFIEIFQKFVNQVIKNEIGSVKRERDEDGYDDDKTKLEF